MKGVNRVTLLGTLGRDPETKNFSNGGSITQFSMATSESWNDKTTGERIEQTEWHRIVLSNKLGEIAQQYLKKGSQVYIEGSIKTRAYKAADGTEKTVVEIKARELQMLGGKNDNSGQKSGYQQQPQANSDLDDDSIPF